ncbi:FAD-dependent oxidoreductase [Glaciihabitans sp. dw_435]|uniref:protoporphyrinogen/coproporphyrinogen oxidase n=1 Tax=Glaciihabitans sp. dw_435 TaxID=2720081 RepID=UPI0027DBDB28|nr:FAD-dependent oxidoreductase [Glaciihabitans sp. dw_435]
MTDATPTPPEDRGPEEPVTGDEPDVVETSYEGTHAIVVGGGVGGLVAARRLVLGGMTVTLIEASDHLGGTVTSHEVGGLTLDAGAESFAIRGNTVATLATSLGLGADIVEPNPEGAWLHQVAGPAVPLPKLSLLGIPGSPLAADVIAVLGFGAAFRAFLEALLPGTFAAKSVTLGELVRRRMGNAVVEKLVAPIVRGVHSGEPDSLDLDRVAPGVRAGMRRTGSLARAVLEVRTARAGSAVAGIRGGIYRIVDALAAELERFGVEVRLNTTVTAVDEGRVMIGDEELTGHVVVATPGILGAPIAAGHLAVLATLVVDQPLLDAAPRGTGVLVAAGAPGIRARALTHATAKWPWLAERAAGTHVLRLSYAERLDGLEEIARADAEALLGVPLPAGSVLGFDIVEWRRPERQEHTPNGISLVGETASGTGLAAVVAQAETRASDLLRDFAP